VSTVGLQFSEMLRDAGIVGGQSPAMQTLNVMVEDLAGTGIPVLLMGESGTGKEVYARLLHELSGECSRPLKKFNCAGIDAARFQSELKNELFTGGDATVARHLFLDGIEELDSPCQRVLLGFLPEEGQKGGNSTAPVRLISSTSRDLEKEVESGRFPRKLYFRINGACLRLPPLRERKEDLAAFLEHFLKKYEQEAKKTVPPIGEDTFAALMAHDWPGNIREFEHLVRKMVALGNTRLAIEDLRIGRREQHRGASTERGSSLKVAARTASRQRERELILEALERTKWNRKRAAQELQISYKALLYKLKQIGVPETSTPK
jgi:two-component system, NtrC family, response regulator AtoC